MKIYKEMEENYHDETKSIVIFNTHLTYYLWSFRNIGLWKQLYIRHGKRNFTGENRYKIL